MIPQAIGRYQIESLLGRGGMASVYRAFDPHFQRLVAVKVLPHELVHDQDFRARFVREAQTIASLEHSAIVPVYDFGEMDAYLYLVMRLMTGGSLADRVAGGALSAVDVVPLVARIASALDEAHARGIVHRDLKPGNILFDQHGQPFLADFGIAKLVSANTSLTGGMILGTPAYMSPEQAHGDRVLDGRSDIYALGVIVFEILAGAPPYEADTPIRLAMKHVLDPIPSIRSLRPDLPVVLERVLARALAKQPEERFATAGEMAQALAQALQAQGATQGLEHPVAGPPGAEATRVLEQSRRAPVQSRQRTSRLSQPQTLTLAAGAMVVAFVCMGSLMVWGMASPSTPQGSVSLVKPEVRQTTPVATVTLAPTATPAPQPTERPLEPTSPPAPTVTLSVRLSATPQPTKRAVASATPQPTKRAVASATLPVVASATPQPTKRAVASATLPVVAPGSDAQEVTVYADRAWQDTGITLVAGQPVMIEYLSGQWTGGIGTGRWYDGEGDLEARHKCGEVAPQCYEPLPYVYNGTLIGRVGEDAFAVGNRFQLTPQAGGHLLLRMNDHDEGLFDNQGALIVRISEIGAEPLPGRPTQIEVSAAQSWQDTGVWVAAGARVTLVSPSGRWTSARAMGEWFGADGPSSRYICADNIPASDCVEPFPEFPAGHLIGRVGGQRLLIGKQLTFMASEAGMLQLRMNDGDVGLYDNEGSVTVQITTE